MRKFIFSAAPVLSLLASTTFAGDTPLIGIVNFANCITESKHGKKEQENMENLRRQMASLIESTEKELQEISAKLEDIEYLDSLSPKAEEELKIKHQALQEDLGRYQQQFYQVFNHANYQMMQKMSGVIAEASEKVAKARHLDYVINREACFYVCSDFDVTNFVITEMDRAFETEDKTKKLSNNSEESLQIFDESSMNRDN